MMNTQENFSQDDRGMKMSSFFIPLLTAVGLVLGFAGIVLISRVTGPLPLSISQTTTNKQSAFDVTGEAKIATIPDKAEVSLGITVNEPTVKQAQDKANTVINTITEELMKLGVEKKDIKTDSYTLYPQYDYQAGGQRITGYNVNAMVNVSLTDFARLNQAVDMATKAGANQISGISFTLSDEKRKEVENEARQKAVDDAKEKAQKLAAISGMRLGRIINVTEGQSNKIMPYPAMDVAMARESGGGGGAPTNVEPGSTTFSYVVTLSYETN
jgi:uncharacterized protein YggE